MLFSCITSGRPLTALFCWIIACVGSVCSLLVSPWCTLWLPIDLNNFHFSNANAHESFQKRSQSGCQHLPKAFISTNKFHIPLVYTFCLDIWMYLRTHDPGQWVSHAHETPTFRKSLPGDHASPLVQNVSKIMWRILWKNWKRPYYFAWKDYPGLDPKLEPKRNQKKIQYGPNDAICKPEKTQKQTLQPTPLFNARLLMFSISDFPPNCVASAWATGHICFFYLDQLWADLLWKGWSDNTDGFLIWYLVSLTI